MRIASLPRHDCLSRYQHRDLLRRAASALSTEGHVAIEALEVGDTVAVSDAARLECLVGPLQSGDAAIFADYQQFFASPEIQMLPVTATAWERAAQLRALYRFGPLDSIHLASAIEHGCGMFLTNDAQLARCTAIPVEVLT